MMKRDCLNIRRHGGALWGFAIFICLSLTSLPLGAVGTNNVLLIIADDLGTDSFRSYNTNAQASFPYMPTIDRLARDGVTFRNAYGQPTCSPTRCTILTGRYGFRTGIGYALASTFGPSLGASEYTLPEALTNAIPGLPHAMVGKWHLSFDENDPNTLGGFSHFSGGILGELGAYDDWPRKVINGAVLRNYTSYATTDNLKDATNWISAQGTSPWFLWLAFNACHEPLHLPPANLHTNTSLTGDDADIQARPRAYYEAISQSLDITISNLLAFLGPRTNNTTIIFMGDNGTPYRNIQPPYTTNQAKGTLFEGGIRIPLIVSGAGVTPKNSYNDTLVSTVDLYPTILELLGVKLSSLPASQVLDGQSFSPLLAGATDDRERYVLAENFGNSVPSTRAGRAIRNSRYKLIQLDDGAQYFYDLPSDPFEHTNLLSGELNQAEQEQYSALIRKLADWQAFPPPSVTGFELWTNRFAVDTEHGTNARTWLCVNSRLDYPVWNVVTNAVAVTTSTTSTRFVDPNEPARSGPRFYRVGLRPVSASTNAAAGWKDWD